MTILHQEHVEADIIIILSGCERKMKAVTEVHKIIFQKYDIKSNKTDQQLILKTIVRMSARGQLSIEKIENITYLKLSDE